MAASAAIPVVRRDKIPVSALETVLSHKFLQDVTYCNNWIKFV
jgi:hypothetical protein